MRSHGGGRLTITRTEIDVELGSLSRRFTGIDRFRHTNRRVTMLKARLVPPWFNTRLVIEEGDQVALVSLPGWSRGRLRRALRAAGFEVDERHGLNP